MSIFKMWMVALVLAAVGGAAHAQVQSVVVNQKYGTTKLGAQWSGTMSVGSIYHPAGNYLSIRWRDYLPPPNTPWNGLYARVCMNWTDSGIAGDSLKVRLVDQSGNGILEGQFPATYSGSGLYHSECATQLDWTQITQFSACGASWATSCDLQVSTTGTYDVRIRDVWVEFMTP